MQSDQRGPSSDALRLNYRTCVLWRMVRTLSDALHTLWYCGMLSSLCPCSCGKVCNASELTGEELIDIREQPPHSLHSGVMYGDKTWVGECRLPIISAFKSTELKRRTRRFFPGPRAKSITLRPSRNASSGTASGHHRRASVAASSVAACPSGQSSPDQWSCCMG